MSKNPSSQNDFMLATQFPLKLSFACTAHKMQGSTVSKPDSLAIDLNSVREAAQGYVMMSRVQSMNQLFILDSFESDKIYPSDIAMEELKSLYNMALNDQVKARQEKVLLTSLNIRSLPRHHKNLLFDPLIKGSIIALQETSCEPGEEYSNLQLPGYELHLVSQGRGKGIAVYFNADFHVSGSINKEFYQISRLSSSKTDVTNISRGANKANFLRDLGTLAKCMKPCIIVGDFNIDYNGNPNEVIIKTIESCKFKQFISSSTHIHGGLIDHVYVRESSKQYDVQINFPFYSDHAAISILEEDI